MAAPLRVHLADDHTMFREGLEAILASREEVRAALGRLPRESLYP